MDCDLLTITDTRQTLLIKQPNQKANCVLQKMVKIDIKNNLGLRVIIIGTHGMIELE